MRRRIVVLVLTVAATIGPAELLAHEASAWGGLFRSRDGGATWLHLNPGSFAAGAIALAVSPTDSHHLLLATDSGLTRSRNGGRDWSIEAPDVIAGPVFAAAFDADGERTLVSGASAFFASDDGRWRRLRGPAGSAPARALVSGSLRGRVYLAGLSGVYRSDDWGGSWIDIGRGLPAAPASALVVRGARADEVLVAAGGRFFAGTDAGRSWERRGEGLPASGIETVTVDAADGNRLWAVAGGQVFRSDDRGHRWRPHGVSLPDRPIVARAIVAPGPAIVIATHRGLYRSVDGGERWAATTDDLPAHLESGFLVLDPRDAQVLHTGFAVVPHAELARRAVEERTVLDRLAPLVGSGLTIVALSVLAVAVVAWRLARTRLPVSRSVTR